MDKKTLYIIVAVLSIVVIVFIVYEAWPSPGNNSGSTVTQSGLAAAAAAQPASTTPMSATQANTIASALTNAYGSGSSWYSGYFSTAAQICQPLQTAAIQAGTQSNWAMILSAYTLQNPGHNLISDVQNQITEHSLISSDTTSVAAIQNYILTLPQ